MALTQAQLQTLKTAINADPTLSSKPLGSDGAVEIAAILNVPQNPAFIVWKSTETIASVGATVNYVAFEALTTANLEKINTFTSLNKEKFPPSKSDIRSFWANVFSGALGGQGQATRDALDALWRRSATYGERIFATGTGTTLSPGTLTFEGQISYPDVEAARSLP